LETQTISDSGSQALAAGKGYTFADVTRLGHEIRSIDDELYEQEGFALERTARNLSDISRHHSDYWRTMMGHPDIR